MTRFYRKEGGFLHLSGDTFPVKDDIKSVGARWDGRVRQWVVRDAPQTLSYLEALGFFALVSMPAAPSATAAATPTAPLAPAFPLDTPAAPLANDSGERLWRVGDFVQFVDEVFSRNLGFDFWIVGEVTSLRISNGHCYFDLAERDEDAAQALNGGPVALPELSGPGPAGSRGKGGRLGRALSVSCVLWAGKRALIEKQRQELPLAEGVAVKIRVHAEFRKEQTRINLIIDDCDPAFTLGGLALQRLAIVKELKKRGLYDANRRTSLPPFPLRIALVTADASRAITDFVDELRVSGLAFRITLLDCHMQGDNTSRDLCAALRRVSQDADAFDVVVITRGGGSRLDLRWFDDIEIAKAIALSPLPVITAIGHFEDVSVADEVSFLAEKTPTGAAGHLVEHTLRSVQRCEEGLARGATLVGRRVRTMRDTLERGRTSLAQAVRWRFAVERGRLNGHAQTLRIVKAQVARPLARGYAMARDAKGRIVKARDFLDAQGQPLAAGALREAAEVTVTFLDATTSREVDVRARVLLVEARPQEETGLPSHTPPMPT